MNKPDRQCALPPSLPPRGVRREQAAAYIGLSPRKFDEMVQDGRMPPPKKIDSVRVWDLRRLDIAFDRLPESGGNTDADDANEWNFKA